jgi:predicted permease
LENVGLWRSGPATVTGLDRPEQVQALFVTREILPILGVPPQLGRDFSAQDDTPGGAPTVVLTFGYWQRRFGGNTSVIGRMLTVDGQRSEIIGVLPQRFRFLDRPIDLVYPFQLDRSSVTLGRYVFQSLARLKPGVRMADASTDLARIVPIAIARFPPPAGYTRGQFARRPMTPLVRPLKDVVVGQSGRMLWIVMGALGLVMLIVCANVANLLLVRADGRRQELAVRAALGASWMRIAGELLVESLLLGVAGGIAGLAIAYGALHAVLSLSGANLPRLDEIGIDRVALVFTCGVSLLAGVCFGLLPVTRYANPRLATSLAGGGRAMSDGRDRQRARGVLVMTQVAMALVLLICSGLMIRTFVALNHVDPGFAQAESIQLVEIDASRPDPERTTRTQQAIVDRIAAIPGVTSAAFGDLAPLGANNSGNDTVLTVDRSVFADTQPRPLRRFEFISPGLFHTLGTPLVAGREFTWTDLYDRRRVALVSERLARDEWGTAADALGRRVRAAPSDPWREIVGVIGDLHDDGPGRPAPPIVYFPALMNEFWGTPVVSFGSVTFAIRTSRAGSESLLKDIQQAVSDVDPDIAAAQVRTLADDYHRMLAQTSFTLTMLLLAGAMGLLLGFIGIYGVIAYDVARRTREIGIRVALGASAGGLIRMFVRHGVTLATIGVVTGAVAALVTSRVLSSLLFGVGPLDPWTYAVVVSLVLVVAATASYLPARRTTAREAIDALKTT